MIKVGIIFKTGRHYKVFDLGLLYVLFFFIIILNCHTSISSVCKINACISESYNSDVQPNLEAKYCLEQMDPSNTGMSYELAILLSNFCLTNEPSYIY